MPPDLSYFRLKVFCRIGSLSEFRYLFYRTAAVKIRVNIMGNDPGLQIFCSAEGRICAA